MADTTNFPNPSREIATVSEIQGGTGKNIITPEKKLAANKYNISGNAVVPNEDGDYEFGHWYQDGATNMYFKVENNALEIRGYQTTGSQQGPAGGYYYANTPNYTFPITFLSTPTAVASARSTWAGANESVHTLNTTTIQGMTSSTRSGAVGSTNIHFNVKGEVSY
jgi:hypothetical protein